MKVKGIKVEKTNVEVEVSPEEIFATLRNFVFSKLGLGSEYYLKEIKGQQNVYSLEEYHTSHSWTTEEMKIEKPSKAQVLAIELFDQLKELMKEIEK